MVFTTPVTVNVGQLINAAHLNTYLRDNLNALNGGGAVPTGLIALWGDQISTIPAGWVHNDNAGGAIIDLRNKFVIGAGSTYAVGDSGGATSQSPVAHSEHVVTQPAHSAHIVTQPAAHGDLGNGPISPNNASNLTGISHSGAAVTGSHTHANAALSTGNHTHSAISVLPPYHARAFMQKVAPGTSFTTPKTWTDGPGQVPTAAELNADLRDNVTHLASLVCAQSSIIMWSGSLGSLPGGWLLCNGSNGTPDLRDKFVVGAGDTYVVGATGGALTASLGSHANHTPTQADAHSDHSVTQPNSHGSTTAAGGGATVSIDPAHVGFAVNAHSAHSGFAVDAHSDHAAVDTVPSYYAYAYIMLASGSVLTTPKTWTTSEIVQSSEFNTYLRDNLLAVYNGQFPIGGIAIWSASIASIPSGYSIVTQLYNRISLGAGSSYAVGASGGAATVTPSAHSSHAVTQPSAHSNHSVTQPAAHATQGGTGPGTSGVLSSYTHTGAAVDAHSAHAFSADAHSAHASINLLPPYIALAYIERTS